MLILFLRITPWVSRREGSGSDRSGRLDPNVSLLFLQVSLVLDLSSCVWKHVLFSLGLLQFAQDRTQIFLHVQFGNAGLHQQLDHLSSEIPPSSSGEQSCGQTYPYDSTIFDMADFVSALLICLKFQVSR